MKKLFTITVLLGVIIILTPTCRKEKFMIPPVAGFTMSSDEVFVNDTVYFKNTSTDAPKYLWDFGDGVTTDKMVHPTHVYTEAGSYTVMFTAYSFDKSKSDKATKTIRVTYPDPVASFTMSGEEAFVNDTVYFTNTSTNASSYKWDFGDGGTSTETSSTHIYHKPDKYIIKLTAYSADGNKSDEATAVISIVHSETDPAASFTMSNDKVFVNEPVSFTNTSTNAASYLWNFGDLQSSIETSPSHSYNNVGDYTVTLTAYSADGTKSDEATATVEVIDSETEPIASFTMPSEVYVNDLVTFTNTSTNAGSYLWEFGDGETSTVGSPNHSYAAVGSYTVKLTAYSATGTQTDEMTKDIKVLALPAASFTMSSDEIYVDETVTFTNTSVNASSYKWEFGDGKTSTETSPSHTYNTFGNYTVKLTAYSADGTKSDEATAALQVINPEMDPEASFTVSNNQVYVNETVSFTNTSTNASSYKWEFGDGQTSTETSPGHTYANAGNYTVKLTAYSADGTKSDEATAQIEVLPEVFPVASFTVSSNNVLVGETVSFTNTSTNASSYLWEFGDGQTSTETSPHHSYANSGNYTVKLTAYSADGNKSDEATTTIQVSYPDPVAGFTYSPTTVYVNEPVHFTNTSANASSYLWEFGDGQTSTETSPNHSYNGSGTYTVTLTAYSPDGTKNDEATATIQVSYHDPVASFTVSSNNVLVGETVSFTNTSTHASSYSWDFGDGQTSTAPSPNHSYTGSGNYTVTLTAYSPDGNKSDEATATIQVNEPDPVAGFTYSPTTVYVNDVVTFTNTSSNAGSYSWNFGDGQTSTQTTPTHTYANSGSYTVTLTAYSPDGTKSDTETKTIQVKKLPVANFTYSPTTVYVNDVVHFTNTSANAGSYSWDFGDGQTSTQTTPTHTYANSGSYTVTLTAYSPDGTKSDTETKTIQVKKLPVAGFTYSPTTVFVNDVVHFTNTSANAGSYSWNFGDGQTSTQTTPTHTYANSGAYTVTLTAYSPDGTKSDEATASIQVNDWGSNLTIQVNGVSFEMIYVEGGTFWMGAQKTDPNGQNYDPEAWDGESPVHQVTLSSYYIGEFEVTQALWQAVMNNNPSSFTGNLQRPVENVSWNDIVNNFIPALNAATGMTFALPTEAQWEYAARGGDESQHYTYSGSNTVGNVAWYDEDWSTGSTHPVGQKQPNELGIYDMSGNVWEWCSDWFGSYSSGSQTNPQGPATGSNHVIRGGSWCSSAGDCRVSFRIYDSPDYHCNNDGFRLVLLP